MRQKYRPLSPHLQVYRLPLSALMSISHRATGIALVGGALLLCCWVVSAAYGPEAFAIIQDLLGSWFGYAILLGLTFSLFYHLGNGIRHLSWDAGWGFDLTTMQITGFMVIAFAIFMTAITFIVGLVV